MVTGVETAGLVLAAFPIIVSGLSCYVQGIQTIRYWRRFRRELTVYAQTLETQRICYLNTLEELLDGIVASDEELAALLSDPKGDAWHKPEYKERLQARLEHSYDTYFLTLTNMIEALVDLGEKLGIDVKGTVRHYLVVL